MRFQGKENFVFPEFYGSWYKTIAKNLKMDEYHVQNIENEFWDMYDGVKNWQNKKYNEYNKKGYVSNLFGFRRHAPLNRNMIINTPIQGMASLFLTHAIIEAGKIMKHEKFDSKIVLQIHDELIPDTIDKEKSQIKDLITECMLNKPWKFTKNVPLACDWKQGPNLYDLEKM